MLDVATGTGEPAIAVAKFVGPEGSVVATDSSPEMLAVARERAAAAGLTNIEFIESDAADLDLPGGSFDAMLSRWGVMLFPDPVPTLKHLRDLLRPLSKMAVAVWGPPDRVPLISLAQGVVAEVLGPPPASGHAINPFKLGAPGALEDVLATAAFREIFPSDVSAVFELPSAAQYVEFIRDVAPPVRQAVASASAEDQERVWQALADRARSHTTPDGTIRLTNEVVCAAAQRPAFF